MSEPDDDILNDVDAPRPLPDALRERLEAALVADAGPLVGADAPRPLPAALQARIVSTLTTPRARRLNRRQVLAVAAAVILIAGAVAANALTGSSAKRTVAAAPASTTTTSTTTTTSPPLAAPSDTTPVAPQAVEAPVEIRLTPFRTCDELLTYLKDNARDRVTPYGVSGIYTYATTASGRMATGPVSPDDPNADSIPVSGGAASGEGGSAQNTQEPGIAEPDRVQADADYAYVLSGSTVNIVDLHSAPPALVSSFPVNQASQLLLAGDRLLVLGPASERREVAPPPGYTGETPLYTQASMTTITSYDITDRTSPSAADMVAVDGYLISARLVNGLARVVVSSPPTGLAFVFPGSYTPDGQQAALDMNRATVEESTIEQWIGDRPCSQVDHPEDFAGLGQTSVYTVDPEAPNATQAVSVLADSSRVYASAQSLYVTTTRWDWLNLGAVTEAPPDVTTQVHRFDLGAAGVARYAGTATVPGYINSSFALSERNGYLRVASTSQFFDSDAATSAVLVFGVEDRALTEVGRVEGFGAGERIQGVRFVGDVGYVVTFRRIDPLFTIDLRDPTNPLMRGELEMTGFSEYLHPVGDSLLLGVGRETDENGRSTGLQVSVIDIGDLDAPTLLDRYTMPSAYSPVEGNHLAFTWWPSQGIAIVPVIRPGATQPALLVCQPTQDGVNALIELPDGADRTAVANGRIYALGYDHVHVFDAFTFEDLGATPLPYDGMPAGMPLAFPD